MEIVNSGNVIKVTGQVNTISDSQKLREVLHENKKHGSIELIFDDADVLPSSILGTFLKLSKADNIKLTIKTKKNSLQEMLKTMRIDDVATVVKF